MLICFTIILFLLYCFNKPEKNPFILAASWQIPSSAPPVQRTAQLQLQSFCKAIFQGLTHPPRSVEVEWTQTGQLQDMAVVINGINDEQVRILRKGGSSGSNPSLVKVPGIQPLDAYADSYTIYAFKNKIGSAMDIVSNHLIHTKSWEEMAVFTHITQLDAFARELDVPRSEVYFVDIGANLGVFTLGIAAAGFQVIAIEAMSVNQFALSLSVCSNLGMAEGVTLLPVALGKEAGQCAVYSARHNALDGTIGCGKAKEDALLQAGMVKRQVVDIIRLDDLLEDWLPALKNRVGSVKMDTEGFEPWVIQGGKKFFSTIRPRFIQLEVSSMSDTATGISSTQMLEGMAGLGYEIREEAFGRPVRARDLHQKPTSNPGNAYLYAKSNGKTVSSEAIDRLEFDKYAGEYEELQKARLQWLAERQGKKKKQIH